MFVDRKLMPALLSSPEFAELKRTSAVEVCRTGGWIEGRGRCWQKGNYFVAFLSCWPSPAHHFDMMAPRHCR